MFSLPSFGDVGIVFGDDSEGTPVTEEWELVHLIWDQFCGGVLG